MVQIFALLAILAKLSEEITLVSIIHVLVKTIIMILELKYVIPAIFLGNFIIIFLK